MLCLSLLVSLKLTVMLKEVNIKSRNKGQPPRLFIPTFIKKINKKCFSQFRQQLLLSYRNEKEKIQHIKKRPQLMRAFFLSKIL